MESCSPDANELGWKETFRINPLEQIFIALRPFFHTPAQVPFMDKVPNSVRLIEPTMLEGDPLEPPPPAGWFDPGGVASRVLQITMLTLVGSICIIAIFSPTKKWT